MLGKITVRYRDGDVVKQQMGSEFVMQNIVEVTGELIPCDGPFGHYIVVHDGEEYVAIQNDMIVTMRGEILPDFIIPVEMIKQQKEMTQMHFEQNKQRIADETTDNGEVYFS